MKYAAEHGILIKFSVLVSCLLLSFVLSQGSIHANTLARSRVKVAGINSTPPQLPDLKLPYRSSETMYWTGGPHEYSKPGALTASFPSGLGSGLDFGNTTSFDVLAMASGTVEETSCYGGLGFGCHVAIRHSVGGTILIYAHLLQGSIVVSNGQNIIQGQIIGKAGNSGTQDVHLHIELRDGGVCNITVDCLPGGLGGNPLGWDDLMPFVDGYQIGSYLVDSEGLQAYNYDGSAVKGNAKVIYNFPFHDQTGSGYISRTGVVRVDSSFPIPPNQCPSADDCERSVPGAATQFAGHGTFGPVVSSPNALRARQLTTAPSGGILLSTNNPPPGPTPPPPTPPPSQNGIELVSVSSHTVRPGEQFNPSVTIRMSSGYLDPSRGDHLHATPESSTNTYGAWPVQPVKTYVPTGGMYTFDVNNDSSFKMTAPTTAGQYQSVWQMRVGGIHIGPQAIIQINVQPNPPSDGVALYENSNYGGSSGIFSYSSNSTCIYLGGMDNRANSIRFLGSYSGNYDAVMYGDNNCGVFNARYFGQYVSDFALLNDQFSSMRIEKHPWEKNVNCGNDGVTLYENPNFGGSCIHANSPAYAETLRDFALNDMVSSAKIVGSWVLYLWEHDSRGGRLIVSSSDVADLSGFSFNDIASSAEIEPPSTCKRLYPSVSPFNTGTVAISTLKNCGDGYKPGTLVQLVATPNAGYAFYYWSGAFSGTSPSTGYQVYVDSNVTANFVVPGSQPPTPPPPPISSVAFGLGVDGDPVINSISYADETRTSLAASVNSGETTIPVASITGFSVGNEVIIHQTQGIPGGQYEFGIISDVAVGRLTLKDKLSNSYAQGGSSRAQVVRVPNYRSLTIQNGGTLSAHSWDGFTGGIVAFRVSRQLDVQAGGKIDVSARGARGAPVNSTGYAGSQGEGQNGLGIQTTGSNWTGGGGGCSMGWGNPAGGGGGGHSSPGTPGNPGNNNDCGTPGAGGISFGIPELTNQIVFGGGGGSGGAKRPQDGGYAGGYGGSGGGIIIAWANLMTVNGAIVANGQTGGVGNGFNTSANGGGGAGGSIRLIAGSGTIGVSNLVTALGGAGGSYFGDYTEDGGPGSIGRIRNEFCDNFSAASIPIASMYRLTCVLDVANDDFNNAITINSTPFVDTRQTLGASNSADDPNLCRVSGEARGGSTTWYRFIPSSDGLVAIDTAGSSYDTVLGVFTGSRTHLTRLTCNDNQNNSNQAFVNFNVSAGVPYYIEVADSRVASSFAKPVRTSQPAQMAGASGGLLSLSLTFASNTMFGSGSDGEPMLTGTSYTDNIRTTLATTAVVGQQYLSIVSSSGIASGDEILIHQSQGTGVGTYEYARVTNSTSVSIALQQGLSNTYNQGGNSRTQVIRVLNYSNLTVPSGVRLTSHAWDGSTGGIVAFRVKGSLNVQTGGSLDADQMGYRGAPTNSSGYGGSQGEGQNGQGSQSTTANGIAGGGGCSNGYGNPAGGGGGGNGTPGISGNPGNNNGCDTPGGAGGSILTGDMAGLISLGGGGGSGGAKRPQDGGFAGGYGGTGGGIVIFSAYNLTLDGTLSANGQAGGLGNGFNTSANGGGGAGGSIRIVVGSGTVNTLLAVYGIGGTYTGDHTEDGGRGGNGNIRVEYCDSFSGASNPPASVFHLTCPIFQSPTVANDDIGNATSINSFPFAEAKDTSGATGSANDPTLCTGNKGSASVWYRVVPTQNKLLTVATVGSNYDTVVAVWRESPGSLLLVGCDDNSGGNLASRLSVPVSAGQQYYIEVADWFTTQGLSARPIVKSPASARALNIYMNLTSLLYYFPFVVR